MNASTCFICGATYIGGYCANCGWYALANAKSPARRLQRQARPEGTNPSGTDRSKVPMTVSVVGGVARPHLYDVSKPHTRGIEVHEVTVEQLTASLNAIRAQTVEESGEVTAFTAMLAAAVEQGRLLGLAEAGVA